MGKIFIGALGMWIYIRHPEWIQYTLEHTKEAIVYVCNWISGHLK